MSNYSGVLANTFYQIIAKIVTAAGAFGATYLITRYLGVRWYGNYTIVITYVTLFYVIVDFGLNNIYLRECGSSGKKFYSNFLNLVLLRSLLAAILIALALLILPLLPFKTTDLQIVRQGVLFGIWLLLFEAWYLSLKAIVEYQRQYLKIIWASLVSAVIGLGAVSLVVVYGGGLVHFIQAALLSHLVLALVLLLVLGKPTTTHFDWGIIKKLVWLSAPVGLSLVLNVLLTNADKFLLSFLANPFQVGLYGLASKMFEVLLVVPTFFVTALYPVVLRAKRAQIAQYRQRLTWGLETALILALPGTVAGVVFSSQLVQILGGADFSGSSLILRVLLLATTLFYLTALIRAVVILEGGERYLPYIYGVGFLFDLLLNLFFIPRLGAVAAAAINGVSEGLILVLLIFVVRRMGLLVVSWKRLSAILLGTFLFSVVCWWGRGLFFVWPVLGGGLLYFLFLHQLKLVNKDLLRV